MQPNDRNASDGFALTNVTCPSCGASLKLHEGVTTIVCDFCGTTLHVSYPQPARTGIDADGTIRDRATGYGLFKGGVPRGWTVAGTTLTHTNTLSRPYVPQVELRSATGAVASLCQGEAGTRQGTGMAMLTSMYGQAAAPYDTSNYAEMPSPIAVADAYVASRAQALGVRDVRLEGQLASPSLDGARARAAQHYTAQARSAGVQLSEFLGAQVVRTYVLVGNEPLRAAVFVEAWAAKGGLAGIGASVEGVAERLGGLFGGRGGRAPATQSSAQTMPPQDSFQQPGQPNPTSQRAQGAGGMLRSAFEFGMGGGLIGKRMREARAAQQAAPAPAAQVHQPAVQAQPMQAQAQRAAGQRPAARQPQAAQPQSGAQPQAPAWCAPDFAAFNQGGTVYWSIDRIVCVIAPQNQLDTLLSGDFATLVATMFTHPDVLRLCQAEAQETDAAIQSNTQAALAASNARFAAQQAAHRQQQAAFNAYNDSISAARDVRQASFRAATNAQFAGPTASGGAGDFSEAIRGVNTFVTSDGREVELSVGSDVAYENRAGDVVGGSSGFDPGADWTQLSRK